MERVSVLCLLLLLCSLSGVTLPDVTEQTGASPVQHPSDVYAELLVMRAKLAELQVKMETQNQEQAAKLKELESQISQLDTQQQARQVAFSASLVASGQITSGPVGSLITLVFKHVISNTGNAYNPITGIFTAPVKGAYHFELYIHGYPDSDHPTAATLMKNTEPIVAAYEKQTSGAVTPANGATLLLEVGDVVFVRQWANSKLFDNVSRHCTFSGHLLFTM